MVLEQELEEEEVEEQVPTKDLELRVGTTVQVNAVTMFMFFKNQCHWTK